MSAADHLGGRALASEGVGSRSALKRPFVLRPAEEFILRCRDLALSAVAVTERIPSYVIGLVIRIGIADVFWRSGRTKVTGWHVTQMTIELFRTSTRFRCCRPSLPPTWQRWGSTYFRSCW